MKNKSYQCTVQPMLVRMEIPLYFWTFRNWKTTLSADPARKLIGDDEHGWDNDNVFNFEGGCYAKCVNLSQDKEPQIFAAIRPGTLLENVRFFDGTDIVNYDDTCH